MRILYASSPASIVIDKDGLLYLRRPGRGDKLLPPQFDPYSLGYVYGFDGKVCPAIPDTASFDVEPFECNDRWGWRLKLVDFSESARFQVEIGTDVQPNDVPHTRALVNLWLSCLPQKLLSQARLQTIQMWLSPQSVQRQADIQEGEQMQGVKGYYDPQRQMIVASMETVPGTSNDGIVLYHELSHSVEYLIPPDKIDQFKSEWPTFRENHFAYAMSQYLVALKTGTLEVFRSVYPKSSRAIEEILSQWS